MIYKMIVFIYKLNGEEEQEILEVNIRAEEANNT